MSGVKRGYWRCAVRLLDGAVVNHDVSQKANGQVLLESVLKNLDICEKEYFSLRFPDNQGGKWLELDRPLRKQVKVSSNDCIKINFCVRFYPPEPTYMQEEISRYQLFLQVRRDIIETRLEVPFRLAAELFALCLQAELGDYEQLERQEGYAEEFHFVPTQTLEMDRLAEDYHRSGFCGGLTPAEAEHCFIDKVRLLDLFGADIFNAEGMNHLKLRLALAPRGIVALREDARDDIYSWPKITKISWKKKKLTIHLFSQEEDHSREVTASYVLPSADDCKYLWQCCMDCHAFYTHMLGSGHIVQPIGRGIFKRSSRRSASGQLEWLKDRDARIKRRPPTFERSASVRFTRPKESNIPSGFHRSASVRLGGDSAPHSNNVQRGSVSHVRVSRSHSVASDRPSGGGTPPAHDVIRSSSGDQPHLMSASSTGNVASSRARVLTTYSAARYRRGSAVSLISAPISPPPVSPLSPVFHSDTIFHTPATSSVRTLESSGAPLASSTPDQHKLNYSTEQERAVQAAARSLHSSRNVVTEAKPSAAEKTEVNRTPLTRARGRRNQPMAVVHPSRKVPATLATEPPPSVKEPIKTTTEVVSAVVPLIMTCTTEQDSTQTDGLFRRGSPAWKRARTPSDASIGKRPVSTSDASYSEGSDAEVKLLPNLDEGPPAYQSECGESEGEIKGPSDDAYSKALREIWVQQDLPPPPPHLLTLASKADRESRETPVLGQPEERNSPGYRPQPSASPYQSSYNQYAARCGQGSPRQRKLAGTHPPMLIDPHSKDASVKSSGKANSLPQGTDPREMALFRRTGSLPRNIKPAWKTLQGASTVQDSFTDVSPVHTRQPIEVTRLVTRVRASSRNSHSSADSSEEGSASPKHERSAPSPGSRSVSFKLDSPGMLRARRPASTNTMSHTSNKGLGLSTSAEDLFAEIQQALDMQREDLKTVGVDTQTQSNSVKKIDTKNQTSTVERSPAHSTSDDAFLSPTSSGSDSSAPEMMQRDRTVCSRRERPVIRNSRRHEQNISVDASRRRQQQLEDLQMVANIKKRYLEGSAKKTAKQATTAGVSPKAIKGDVREMPTASRPYVVSETPPPPSFAPTIPSPLRKRLSADQLRTVQFADSVITKRPAARSSMRRLERVRLSANEIET